MDLTGAMNPIVEELRAKFGSSIHKESDDRGDLSVTVEKERIPDILKHLKASGFEFLIDICGVDYTERQNRFDVV